MLKRTLWAALCAAALMTMLVARAQSGTSNLGYDPQADPFEQYQEAIEAARADNKLVLVIAGGDWCRWCHVLNQFMARNNDVQQSLNDAFVVMKVYVGEENYNEFFFEQLPRAYGAPHFWIISPERQVLSSQSTGQFESGKRGYDKQQLVNFIQHWNAVRAAGGMHAVAREEP